ncbi:sugar ABC transporter substrate-binding protein [Microbacterium murale]|uniref:D-ribose ABC transporter substrate-binding protein n=1 Tax=Microbacterium murale TaxID=1081040 RepID=A0ABQ1RJR7_9MICO|nr:sugar ABC transporter substrate-binding protein [Microbacterium murale]GGD70625.1 D-ribose ABC transporter substrate-binding protein [Microbacterium murale]
MNRQRRLIPLLTATIAAGLVFTGCSASGTDSGDDAAAGGDAATKIGFISSANNEWGACLQNGMESAAEAEGVELLVANSDADAAKETGNIEDMIARGVDAIVLNTVSVDAMAGGIQKANAADVPIYLVAVVPDDLTGVLGAAVVDLPGVGGIAADWIAEDSGGDDVNVAVIGGAPGASSDYVVNGFKEAVASNVTIVGEQPGMYNRGKAQEVAENFAQSNPDLDYVFVLNEDMAFGARSAFDAAGMDDVRIVTMNGTDDGLAAIESGEFSATVADSAANLGVTSIENTLALLKDVSGEKVFAMPTALITDANLDEAIPFCG